MKARLVVEDKGVAEDDVERGGSSVCSFLYAVVGTSKLRVRVGVVLEVRWRSRFGVARGVGVASDLGVDLKVALVSALAVSLCCLEWLARLNGEGVFPFLRTLCFWEEGSGVFSSSMAGLASF